MSRTARPVVAALVVAALAFAPLLLTAPASAAVAADGDITWSVEPAPTSEGQRRTFDYSVDPGTQIVDSVLITNQGTTAAEFLIYATDAINEFDTGAFGLLKRDETPTDAGAWITTESEKLTIEPGMQATVPFNLLVPSDAAPGDHVAGIVAAVVTKGETDGAAVTLEQRVGARLYLEVSGVREAGVEVAGVTSGFSASWNPFAPGEITTRFDVTNTGNIRVDVNQAVTVAGPFGIPLGEYTPDAITNLLPRQTVRVEATLPAIAALALAWSTVTLVPGEIGSAGKVDPLETGATATPSATPTDAATAAPEEASTEEASTEEASTEDGSVTDTVVTGDEEAVEFLPVASTVITPAISWTLLAIVLFALGIVYLVVRYISGTRERFYLAIDEAAAAARDDALTAAASKDSADK